jgi:hypothetical protein
LKNCADGTPANDSVLAECHESAEQGSPIAQLILSQLYRTRSSNPTDVLLAYKWCLIARAQLVRTTKDVSKTMPMEQLLYAEKMAADWLRKTQKIASGIVAEAAEREELENGSCEGLLPSLPNLSLVLDAGASQEP